MCFGFQHPNHRLKYWWWWQMITSNTLRFWNYLFLMIDDYIQSNLGYFCLCIRLGSMYIFLLTEHVQTICARFVGSLIAAIYLLVCATMLHFDTHFCNRVYWLCFWHRLPRWLTPCCLRLRKLHIYFWSQLWCWLFICLCDLIVGDNIHHK